MSLRALTYRPLKASTEIRLVTLKRDKSSGALFCQLESARLGKRFLRRRPKYVALSYTWGSPENTHMLRCGYHQRDNTYVQIPTNLYDAMLRISDNPDLHTYRFWMDSICINQGDMRERADQVGMMREIYRDACFVTVWLGELDDELTKACSLLLGLDRLCREEAYDDVMDAIFKTFEQEDWKMCVRFFRNPWFTRVWVFQEFVVARDVFFLHGNWMVHWKTMLNIVVSLLRFGNPVVWDKEASRSGEQLGIMVSFRLLTESDEHDEYDFNPQKTLAFVVDQCRLLNSTDPRDRLFALHGLSIDGHARKSEIDYALSVEQVYTNFARHEVLHRKQLHFLCCATLEGNYGLPSWVPDWTYRPPEGRHLSTAVFEVRSNDAPRDINCRISPDGATLCVTGIIFSGIASIGPIYIAPHNLPYTTDAFEIDFKRILEWYRTNFAIAQEAPEPYPNGQSLIEAFVRCQVLDDIANVSSPGPGSKMKKCSVGDGIRALGRFGLRDGYEKGDLDSYGKGTDTGSEVYQNKLKKSHRFCRTENGYFGWVPHATLATDLVARIYSANTQFVLRAGEQPGTYRIVGECYLQGVPVGVGVFASDIGGEIALV